MSYRSKERLFAFKLSRIWQMIFEVIDEVARKRYSTLSNHLELQMKITAHPAYQYWQSLKRRTKNEPRPLFATVYDHKHPVRAER